METRYGATTAAGSSGRAQETGPELLISANSGQTHGRESTLAGLQSHVGADKGGRELMQKINIEDRKSR